MPEVITNLWKFLGIYLLCLTSAQTQGILRTAYPPMYASTTNADVPRINGTFTGYSETNETTTGYPPTNGTTTEYPPIRTNGTTSKSLIDPSFIPALHKYVYCGHSDVSSHKADFGWVEFVAGHISALAILCVVKVIWYVCKCSQKFSRYRFRKPSYITDFLQPGDDYFCSQKIEPKQATETEELKCGTLDKKINDDASIPQIFANKY